VCVCVCVCSSNRILGKAQKARWDHDDPIAQIGALTFITPADRHRHFIAAALLACLYYLGGREGDARIAFSGLGGRYYCVAQLRLRNAGTILDACLHLQMPRTSRPHERGSTGSSSQPEVSGDRDEWTPTTGWYRYPS
jgi:hypothetical protein